MNSPSNSNHTLLKLAEDYWNWRWLWLASTACFGLLGLFYVVFLKHDMWVASQGLIVRDEANGAVMRLGRFESQTQMKAAQETVLEMARNAQVLSDALKAVGHEPGWSLFGFGATPAEPSAAEIEDLAKNAITVRAPRGAELGTTEVIYLDVKQSSRERAVALNEAVGDALEMRLKQVRQARADGVVKELLAAKKAATVNLQLATKQLREMESNVGTDLSDLRGLTDTVSSASSTRQSLDAIAKSLFEAELELQQIQVDLETARVSFDNPEQLLQTPTKLVNTHPGLTRLREGLAAASIRSSELQGRYTPQHPLVIASLATEAKIRTEMRVELGVSVETLEKDFQIARGKVARLNEQRSLLTDRIAKLASVRAEYGNVASEVRARNEQLQGIERELASAEAAREAAQTSSLITRIDKPLIGENPVGPGRSTILAGATVGGLFFGFGLVFLLSPLDGNSNFGRRQYDYSGAVGRRASDPEGAPAAAPSQVAPSQVAFAQTSVPAQSATERHTASSTNAQPSNASATGRSLSEEANSIRPTNHYASSQQSKPKTITDAIRSQNLAQRSDESTELDGGMFASDLPTLGQTRAESSDVASSSYDTSQVDNLGTEISEITPRVVEPDEDSIKAAQAVIAAALSGTFPSADSDAPTVES